MLSLCVSILFFFITKQILQNYNSRQLQLVHQLSIYAGVIGIVSVLLMQFNVGNLFQYASLLLLYLSCLIAYGFKYRPWMLYMWGGISLVAAAISIVSLPAAGLLIVIANIVILIQQHKSIPFQKNILFASIGLCLMIVLDSILPNPYSKTIAGIMIVYVLVSRLIAYLHAVYYKSITDRLTGLYTREKFFEYAANLLAAESSQKGLVYLHIDNVRETSETEGYQASEAIVSKVAEFLNQAIRGNGIAGIITADEIAVFIIETDAYEFAEKIRKDMLAVLGVTISISVAYPKTSAIDTIEEMIHRAYACIHKAIGLGKTKVVISNYENAQ